MPGEPSLSEEQSADRPVAVRLRAAERLSRTANRLFYQRGIRAVGVEEIVAQAGVTKPSLYRSFTSKDALISSCLETRYHRIMAWWDELETRLPGDPTGQLRTLIAEIAEETSAPDYRGCALTNAAVEFPEIGHPARMIARRYKATMRDRLLGLAERLPTDRPALLTDALILLFEGARASRHTSGGEGPSASLKASADALLSAFLSADRRDLG